ncbi:hypothetical protein O7599_06365 [Streptomyces sp. WMMC500]|uniref:hypothetical protein n=1 Tax=Streptomyces sp. WMMC500 TaxID=3015154 RepID=UPI00248AF6EB|nr:hypothetical protein [Streptomyces sp. WMMC500]WBB62152.1 hypothetical protein O7599_06365 [Streptomyces sp. WMMC500]
MSQRPPRRVARSWKAYLAIALLVGIPLVYGWISTQQSRESGRDKAERAAYTEMEPGWPPRLLRRIYQVPVPGGAEYISYYEENALHDSALYVDFTGPQQSVDEYLEVTFSRSDVRPLPRLRDGFNPVTPAQAETAGWDFTEGNWSGLKLTQPGALPDVSIVVNTADPENLVVRTVSTAEY